MIKITSENETVCLTVTVYQLMEYISLPERKMKSGSNFPQVLQNIDITSKQAPGL